MLATVIFIQSLVNAACVPKPLTIAGDSMSPFLKNGDVIFVRVTTEEIRRGEVVYMTQPKENYPMVARVIGLPGEEILIKENKAYVDGQLLDEPYVLPENNLERLKEGVYRVNPEHYFVLSDNRDNSLDSRYFGVVGRDLIPARYHSTYKKADEK